MILQGQYIYAVMLLTVLQVQYLYNSNHFFFRLSEQAGTILYVSLSWYEIFSMSPCAIKYQSASLSEQAVTIPQVS